MSGRSGRLRTQQPGRDHLGQRLYADPEPNAGAVFSSHSDAHPGATDAPTDSDAKSHAKSNAASKLRQAQPAALLG